MATKEDLVRIGIDGFDLVERYMEKKQYAPKRHAVPGGTRQACLYQYQPQQAHVYQLKPVSAEETMMYNYEVRQFRDGVSVMDYSKRKSAAMSS
ncbi:UNVERIFIED_CONTAM: hypothetical protein Sindi_1567200 [Sesamum indicum]